MDGWMVDGLREPHGARLNHVLIFVIRPLGRTEIRGMPRSLGHVPGGEGGWLAIPSWIMGRVMLA